MHHAARRFSLLARLFTHLISWSAAMWASGPATAARPVEAGLGPARDGWPPTSALALLVKMAAVAIAATKVQSYSAQASGLWRLSSVVAFRTHARSARHEPSAIRSRSQKLLARTAADSAIAAAAVELFAEDWCLICCLPADAAGEPGGPLYYKDVLTRFYLEFFYPRDPTNECDRTIGSFGHQSGITREQLSLPLASPPSPSGIRGILWVVQSIDLWRVSQPHFVTLRAP